MKKLGFRISDDSSALRETVQPSDTVIDVTRVLAMLRRRRWAIIASVVVWIVVGFVNVATTPDFYYARSTVLLDQNIDRAIQQVSTVTDVSTTDSAMESARLVILSDAVARRVAAELDLANSASFTNPPSSLRSRVIGGLYGTARGILDFVMPRPAPVASETAAMPTPEEIEQIRINAVAQALQAQVSVARIARSSAFAITYRSHDPVLATEIVNTFAQVYVADVLNANYEATERMTTWMSERLTDLELDARDAAQAAELFRAENGLVASRDSTMSEDAVATLNADLSRAIADQARARAQVTAMEAVVANGVEALRTGLPTGLPSLDDIEFNTRQEVLSNAIVNLARLREAAEPDDPRLAANETRVEVAAERLFATIQRLLEEARGEETLAGARVDALQSSLRQAVIDDAEAGPAQVRLRTLEQRADTLSALYQSFLARFQEVDQQRSFPVSNVRVLNLAQIPRAPAGPSTTMAVLLCLVLGLMTGLVIMVIREFRDRFMRTGHQVTDEMGVPFLGYLPMMQPAPFHGGSKIEKTPYPPRDEAAKGEQTLPVPGEEPAKARKVIGQHFFALTSPRSQYAETLRNIRLSSGLAGSMSDSIVLGLTSSRPGEGKSVTSLNLATIIAAAGSSVVVIDADPHRSGLSRLLGLTRTAGLLDILIGKKTWQDVTRKIPGTGVAMIPGLVPQDFSHAGEMLGGKAMRKLLADLREEFDYIVLDLAPMGPVVDVRAILTELDQLVLLAEWGKTSKNLLNGLLRNNPEIGPKLLGVALNKVDVTKLAEYVDDSDTATYLSEYEAYVGRS